MMLAIVPDVTVYSKAVMKLVDCWFFVAIGQFIFNLGHLLLSEIEFR